MSNFVFWDQRKFQYFSDHGKEIISENQFFNTDTSLLENVIQNYYSELYKQRNRLAHNVVSYQQNLPSLIELREEDDTSRNYFIYFAILTLIDDIFMETYKTFKEELDTYNY